MNKFELSPVTKSFRNQVKTHLSDSSVRVIAGISGGPDSMAMLYLLHRFDIETIVVHCNYQLRGGASDKDQKLVEDICMHWSIECISMRLDSSEEQTGNFQDWARQRRYQAYEDIKKEYSADLILTAHHQDDQLETILQKILRGSGLDAWKGMEVLDGYLFRPLLNLSKSEIMKFVQQFNVPYRIDRTNEESTYARNFIRNHWFPDLNRLFPGWRKNLQKLADRAEEFGLMTDLILQKVSTTGNRLIRDDFLELDTKIRASILLQFLKKNTEDIEISRGFLKSIDKIGELQSGGKLQVSEFHILYRDRDFFKIIDDSDLKEFNQVINKSQLEESLTISDWKLSFVPPPKSYSDDILHLDEEKIEFPITLRRWKDGDSFQPLGMDGTQLVSDHLTNRKIPSTKKKQALVLESFDGSISALIFPNYSKSSELGTISERVRCTSSTKRTLKITKAN
ncbi:tRNA lysidine(34) synthetase TilS [Rhodohalobacter sulfatireducens]|uniref:tRNA(Ile)-lysidine synthase n=1 Tax=Rhodohalobacter sulfatireducens TaxID=2911366 RepID=A0ABS9KE82_9BACT|nr:tRNA lysidine(34) synthetase TilS [Rhodohalobacter sulfatireducens]MCG2589141.1 tRNA lysidine(34) synthetase TilS [Rhodohalobacter sulfatireducens]